MAGTDVGTGTTLTYGTSFFAEIVSMDIDGAEIPVIDAPHMGGAGVHKLIFGKLQRPPQLTLEVNLDADKDWKSKIAATTESVTITFPIPAGGSSGATWSFTGKMVSFSASIPVEDRMSATAVIQATTLPTFVASA